MVMYANLPDLPEMLVWRQALQDGGLFVDVGANVGTYASRAAEVGGEVIAVEPATDTFGLLLESIALNGYLVMAVMLRTSVEYNQRYEAVSVRLKGMAVQSGTTFSITGIPRYPGPVHSSTGPPRPGPAPVAR